VVLARWTDPQKISRMKYASVFQRKQSPRWSVVYWCPVAQKRQYKTTPFLVTDPNGRRKAQALANEKSKDAQADKDVGGADRWENWVEAYLNDRFKNQQKTLRRYIYAWAKQWAVFLLESKIRVPRGLDYNAVLKFIAWRTAQTKPSSGKRVSKNTALCDTKVMSIVMREAMRRGFAETNHCEKLGIQKDPAKQKPEISDEELVKIIRELATRPEWMRVAFEIALYQGCRLSETSLPLDRVDLNRRTITFSAKGRGGGEKHVFTTKLHPALVSLMTRLKKSGATLTCVLPVMAAKEFHNFFREVELPHLCFHCTRVTVITRMARAGVPISQAMSFVGHASETIHRIYQRLAAADLSRAVDAISYGGSATQQNQDAGPASAERDAA
jgi:integrase